jgi:DNA-binding response OmpR family regulator
MSFISMFGVKKTVLIVEDDSVLRATLEERFRNEGYEVAAAGDANEVLLIIENTKPDALILDLILPLKDGITLLEELRASGYGLPVFLLSNLLGSELLRNDATRLGASYFNKSSTSPDDLVAAVTAALKKI